MLWVTGYTFPQLLSAASSMTLIVFSLCLLDIFNVSGRNPLGVSCRRVVPGGFLQSCGGGELGTGRVAWMKL